MLICIMADNLKQRTISGVVWSAIHKFASMLLGFISGIVLARLLTPHDYGVIGMLTIFLAIAQTFIDGGFGSALIQKKNPTDEDYSTILYWNLGLSVFLYLVLFGCAPFIARFYDLPLLSDVLRVQGLVLIINAARIVQRNQLRKRLEMKKVALINVSSSVVSLLVTIYLAWCGWGVWALVAQQLLLGVLCTTLYWITTRWIPVLTFSTKSFKELFSFGGFVLLSNLFNTFCNNIQGLLIGKIYNSSTLGYYTKARTTETYASTFISSVLDQVCYPVLSESQNERERLIAIIKKFIGVSAFLTFPLMLILMLLAKPIFILLYSDRWLPSVPYFQILCFAGIAICLQGINYYAVAAIGKSKDLFVWTIVKRCVGLGFILAGLSLWGIEGLLVGMVFGSFSIYIINAALASKHVGYTLNQQMKDLMPIILLSAVSTFSALVWPIILTCNMYVMGLLQLTTFGVVYMVGSVLLKLEAFESTKEVLGVLISKYKKNNNNDYNRKTLFGARR